MRTIIYCRKSSESSDRQAHSIDDQYNECMSYTKFIESTEFLYLPPPKDSERAYCWAESCSSWYVDQRSVYKQMIDAIDQGKVDVVVVYAVNRLARNEEEGGRIIRRLREGMFKMLIVGGQVYEPRNASQALMLLLQVGQATMENEERSKSVKRGLKSKRKRGGWGGKAVTGYINAYDSKATEKNFVIPDPERAFYIKRIFERARDKWTYEQIADTINKEGYRSSSMRNSKNEEIGQRPIAKSIVGRMLRNPFYAGYVICEEELIKGLHEPIISLELFNEVQKTLENRGINPRRPRRSEGEYSFASVFDCACGGKFSTEQKTRFTPSCCGKRITRREMPINCPNCGETIKKKEWTRGKTYRYLKCSRRCGERKHAKESEIQDFLTKRIDELNFSDEVLDFLDEEAKRIQHIQTENNAEQIQIYTKQIESHKERQSRLVEMRMNDEIEASAFKQKQEEIRKSILETEEAKEKLHNKKDERISFLQSAKTLKDKFISVFSGTSAILKRQLLNELFDRCVFENGELVWQWREEISDLVKNE